MITIRAVALVIYVCYAIWGFMDAWVLTPSTRRVFAKHHDALESRGITSSRNRTMSFAVSYIISVIIGGALLFYTPTTYAVMGGVVGSFALLLMYAVQFALKNGILPEEDQALFQDEYGKACRINAVISSFIFWPISVHCEVRALLRHRPEKDDGIE